jgi:hypothetical protein
MSPTALAKLNSFYKEHLKRNIEERKKRNGRTVMCSRINGKVKRQKNEKRKNK